MGERNGVPRYLKPTIAVGSRHRKTREEPTLPSLLNPRAYILSRSPLHHDHPQAVLFPLSRNTAPRFHPLYLLLLLTPRDSPIDEPQREEERPARTNRRIRIR